MTNALHIRPRQITVCRHRQRGQPQLTFQEILPDLEFVQGKDNPEKRIRGYKTRALQPRNRRRRHTAALRKIRLRPIRTLTFLSHPLPHAIQDISRLRQLEDSLIRHHAE